MTPENIADKVRSSYLKFFEENGHAVIPSSSLVPHGDPTLLLTSAGMVQFKPYYLGQAVPPNPRLASCQKCFRFSDIESVGDSSHLTFFEMLGNFSIGNYFKQEAIAWAWEFCTRRISLPPEKLWITIYLDDDESLNYWKKIGVPESRILRFGERENFWGPAGNSGPCGPCSELHYDFGAEIGCGKPDCRPNSGCPRFIEIWNLVFTQYNQDESGKRTPLPKPNIDTGAGLERVVAAVTGKPSVYQTPLFTPLLDKLGQVSGKSYGVRNDIDFAMRVVAEHSRGIPFLISDGVLPANDGRGYVLRRLIRRAVLFGRKLELEKPFLVDMAQVTIRNMGGIYPELVKGKDFISRVIELEEKRFSETLSAGLELLDDVVRKLGSSGSKVISGEQAFRLYDTYGFPVELTREIAGERGYSVDSNGFKAEMEKQRERARSVERFTSGKGAVVPEAAITRSFDSTPFVGYETTSHKSIIIEMIEDGKTADSIEKGQKASVILETTPFYGEMGGQVGDAGVIVGEHGIFQVTDTIRIAPDIVVHRGVVAEGTFGAGDEVTAIVDPERRLDIARNHTATHLLHYALRQVLGKHVQQRGSLVTPDGFRFDFSHLTQVAPDELQKVQEIVNQTIRRNLRVYAEQCPYKQAQEEGVIALFDEKYGDIVRVLRVGEPAISAELCGGTHVSWTGEIGFFQLTGESSIGAGLRRIEAVTGRGAEAFIKKRLAALNNISHTLGTVPDEVESKVSGLIESANNERRLRERMELELSRKEVESLLEKKEQVNGVTYLVAKLPAARMEVLREMSDFIRDKLKSAVVVLGSVYEERPIFLAAVTPDLVEKGYNAGDIIRQVAKAAGGGGGGKPNLAQAGGKDKGKLDEALRLAKKLIEEHK